MHGKEKLWKESLRSIKNAMMRFGLNEGGSQRGGHKKLLHMECGR